METPTVSDIGMWHGQHTAVRIHRGNDTIKTDLKQYVCVCVWHLLGSRELSIEPPRFTKCGKFRATAGRLSAAQEWLLQGQSCCTVCQKTAMAVLSAVWLQFVYPALRHAWLTDRPTDWLTDRPTDCQFPPPPHIPAALSSPRRCTTTEQSVRLAVQALLVFMTSF
jgi:hypothetical protein